MSSVGGVSLTRVKIEEIVGKDQQKVRAIEALLENTIFSFTEGGEEGEQKITRWYNGKKEIYGFIETSATEMTEVTFPEEFFSDDINVQLTLISSETDVESVKLSSFDKKSFFLFVTNGSLVAREVFWKVTGTWK